MAAWWATRITLSTQMKDNLMQAYRCGIGRLFELRLATDSNRASVNIDPAIPRPPQLMRLLTLAVIGKPFRASRNCCTAMAP